MTLNLAVGLFDLFMIGFMLGIGATVIVQTIWRDK